MTDHSPIKSALLQIYPFTADELNQFTSRLIFKKLSKKSFLLKPSQVSDGISFVMSGSLRMYTSTASHESTLSFFTENSWVADIESLLMQQPAINFIEATEDTFVAKITLRDVHLLMENYPRFRMLNKLLTHLTISATHVVAIKTKSPDERYTEFLSMYPNWLLRFPQNQIASYLGMTPETLSRVRARIA